MGAGDDGNYVLEDLNFHVVGVSEETLICSGGGSMAKGGLHQQRAARASDHRLEAQVRGP